LPDLQKWLETLCKNDVPLHQYKIIFHNWYEPRHFFSFFFLFFANQNTWGCNKLARPTTTPKSQQGTLIRHNPLSVILWNE